MPGKAVLDRGKKATAGSHVKKGKIVSTLGIRISLCKKGERGGGGEDVASLWGLGNGRPAACKRGKKNRRTVANERGGKKKLGISQCFGQLRGLEKEKTVTSDKKKLKGEIIPTGTSNTLQPGLGGKEKRK